ncbi:MAG: hypothetical protein R3A78_08090 [Polyangiales bacterium]
MSLLGRSFANDIGGGSPRSGATSFDVNLSATGDGVNAHLHEETTPSVSWQASTASAVTNAARLGWEAVTANRLAGAIEVLDRSVVQHYAPRVERWTLRGADGTVFEAAAKLGGDAAATAGAEAAYHRLDSLLGGETVAPAAVARELPDGEGLGSLQAWVQGDRLEDLPSAEELELIMNPDLRRIFMTGLLAGDFDSHRGNLRRLAGDRMIGIDHAESFSPYLLHRIRSPLRDSAKYSLYLYRPTDAFTERLHALNLQQLAAAFADEGIASSAIRSTLFRTRSLQRDPHQFEPLGRRLASFTDDNWDAPILEFARLSDETLPGITTSDIRDIDSALASRAEAAAPSTAQPSF